jgi:hypothetical protein
VKILHTRAGSPSRLKLKTVPLIIDKFILNEPG